MRKLKGFFVIALAACALPACKHTAKNYNFMNTDTAAAAAQDTSATLNMAVDRDDSQFAAEAASGNMAEIALGKLAIANGKSKQVKNFGAMMVKDHSKANLKLAVLAKTKNITLPSAPDADEQKVYAELLKKTGDEFDKAYISDMIADHEQDVKRFSDATTKIQDPDIKAFAQKTLPILQNHLDAINAIHDSMP